MWRRRLAVFAAALLVAACCARADEPPATLDILLTNDDGYDAPGIRILRAALEAEGHRVQVVAPADNRSGSSVAISTHGTLTWRQVEPQVIAVSGTPADCVRLALTMLLKERPDLLVSGVNFGQNVGAATLSSGTVGAALTGASLGVPSIAVSQAVDPNDLTGTVRYFPDAAAVTVALVSELAAAGDPFLPRGTALNVNHPPRKVVDLEGVKLTRQGHSTLYSVVYEKQGDGSVSMAFAPSLVKETVPNADTTALAAGYVSVTPLDGSWTAEAAFEGLRGVAKTLDSRVRSRNAAAVDP